MKDSNRLALILEFKPVAYCFVGVFAVLTGFLTLPLKKYARVNDIVDGENNAIRLDHAYRVNNLSVDQAVAEIIATHGDNVCLLPLSGMSGGAGVFQVETGDDAEIVGLHFDACVEPRVSRSESVEITRVALDEIIIDESEALIYAGSAISLDQLNKTLAVELGSGFRVLGADLTSYTYAQVGATFMTGGMGPQRRYFSDSVTQISLHNGHELVLVDGEALNDYAGTYGWSGLVSAVCCRYFKLPHDEVAFAIPVNNHPDALSRLLQHFSPFCFLQTDSGEVLTQSGGRDIILGLEHLTIESMQPFLRDGDNALVDRARQLQINCELANADGLIFVNGYSDLPVDEFLFNLVDDMDADEFTIAGINLEHTEIFKDPEQMRAVREGIPYAARMQAPKGRFSYKGHTDANIQLNPGAVEAAMKQLWLANLDYVTAVQRFFETSKDIKGEILVYGHLNPAGVDPHNRITFACDDEGIYEKAVSNLEGLRDAFILRLAKLCEETGSHFIGGEKGAGSEAEMLPVFGDIENSPPIMAAKFNQQSRVIRAAAHMFNWRALKPYVKSN